MIYTHGTDSGPLCPYCRATFWLYGYLDDAGDDGVTLEARCVPCRRMEHHRVRAVLADVRQIRLQHKEALNNVDRIL